MKRIFPVIAISLLLSSLATLAQAPPARAKLLGTWEGESKCTVAGSACNDEHVLYRVATIKHTAGKLAFHGYKVVHGKLLFMGTLECEYQAEEGKLSCTAGTPKKDAWEFKVTPGEINGTLTIGDEKTLYRTIHVKKMK